MAGFGLPNFGQITEAFKKAQQIQQDAQKLQEELNSMEIEGKSTDELVSVWLSGNQQPLKVEIDKSLKDQPIATVEEKVLEALQNAHDLSTSTMKSRMEEITSGLKLNLPGLNTNDDN